MMAGVPAEKAKRIYLAGHTGMVGSAIHRALRRHGYGDIVTRTHEELDLTDQAAVNALFESVAPEIVIDAAAKVGGIKANSEFPADFLMENLMIQSNLLDASFRSGAGRFIFLASSCMYPRDASMPLKESSILSDCPEPTNEPYAIAKIAGAKACQYYNRQYGTRYCALVPANVYGINDHFDPENSHVIPAMIRRFSEAKEAGLPAVEFWGTGAPLREFLYVDDLAEAVVTIMENEIQEEIINIGSGTEISMKDLAAEIASVVGYEGEVMWDTSKPDGMMRRVVDSTIAESYGWSPATDIVTGLRNTYEWYVSKPVGKATVL
jgi:GDP-L-fucose synthase